MGVQQGQARVVVELVEVGDALAGLGVMHADRHLVHLDAAPQGTDHDLDLERIRLRAAAKTLEGRQRIRPESALDVVYARPGLNAYPEVAERPSEARGAGNGSLREIPHADNQCIGMPVDGLEEMGQIFGIVLTVGVERNHMRIAALAQIALGRAKGLALAPIDVVTDHLDGQTLQQRFDRRLAAVVDDQDAPMLGQAAGDNVPEAIRLIVDRNHYGDVLDRRHVQDRSTMRRFLRAKRTKLPAFRRNRLQLSGDFHTMLAKFHSVLGRV